MVSDSFTKLLSGDPCNRLNSVYCRLQRAGTMFASLDWQRKQPCLASLWLWWSCQGHLAAVVITASIPWLRLVMVMVSCNIIRYSPTQWWVCLSVSWLAWMCVSLFDFVCVSGGCVMLVKSIFKNIKWLLFILTLKNNYFTPKYNHYYSYSVTQS